MLLNMSRYFFDNLFAAETLDPVIAYEKFLVAFKVFIEHLRVDELFENHSHNKCLQWNFSQVIKTLFEG